MREERWGRRDEGRSEWDGGGRAVELEHGVCQSLTASEARVTFRRIREPHLFTPQHSLAAENDRKNGISIAYRARATEGQRRDDVSLKKSPVIN